MDKPKLTYFRGRGLSETVRLAFAVAEAELEDTYVESHAEFAGLRDDGRSMRFQQLPRMEIDGLVLNESNAIGMYIARKFNLLGKNSNEEGRILPLYFGARSYLDCGSIGWCFEDTKEEMEKAKQENIDRSRNRYLPAFEKVLKENGTGFLVGDSPTIADCALYDALTSQTEAEVFKSLGLFDDKPYCVEFMKKFSELPGVKKYLASPRRHPVNDLPIAAYTIEIMYGKRPDHSFLT